MRLRRRRSLRTIEYVVNSDDEQPDFASPGRRFQDDPSRFEG